MFARLFRIRGIFSEQISSRYENLIVYKHKENQRCYSVSILMFDPHKLNSSLKDKCVKKEGYGKITHDKNKRHSSIVNTYEILVNLHL